MSKPQDQHNVAAAEAAFRASASPFRVRHAREILKLATPTILTMLSQTLMWTVDTALLGRVSSLALASAGLGGLLTWTFYSLFNNLSRISGTFVAQAHGKGDDKAVGDYAWQSIYLAVATGAILQVAGYFAYLILPLTRNPPEVLVGTYVYIKWRTASGIAQQLVFSLMGFFQGRRDVKIPMWAGIVSNVVNLVLDLWLIFGWSGVTVGERTWLAMPAMGVKGAAIATSCGVVVNALILLIWMVAPNRHRIRYAIHRPRRLDLTKIWDMVRVGAPAAWEGFVDMSGFLLFSVFIGRAGTVALAANQITIQVLSFSFMPMWGLTIAGSILTGNWIGAGRPDLAAAYGRQVYKLGAYYALALAAVLILLRGHLFAVFTPDPAVLAFGASLAVVAAVFQCCDGMRMVSIGLLQGAGDTRFPMLASLVLLWGVFVPLSYFVIVVHGGNVVTGWTLGAFCYLLMAIVLYARFRSGAWRKVKIFGAERSVESGAERGFEHGVERGEDTDG